MKEDLDKYKKENTQLKINLDKYQKENDKLKEDLININIKYIIKYINIK